MKTIVIIGGGITGLSAAYYLNKTLAARKQQASIILLEATETLGGKISTLHDGDFTMETGADSMVARKPHATALLEELNLQDQVVYNATGKSYIHIDGELKLIPEDALFGIPMSIESLAKTELVSDAGKVAALKDLYTPNEQFTKQDSVGVFLEAFFGRELVERQIAPVLSGVYSGELHELTIASTLPYLLDYKNEYGSIIRGLSANKQKFKSGGGKFLSFQGGTGALVEALAHNMPEVDIRTAVKAERLTKLNGRYRITLAGGEELEADYVVLSTLHTAAQSILQDARLDKDFQQLQNSSLISVYAGFHIPDDCLPKDGTGFITAPDSELTCNACTWTSRKWAHTSQHSHLLIRLFYKSGKPIYEQLQQLSDEELLRIALHDIQQSLDIAEAPVTYNVTKWPHTMPRYHIKHPQIVQSLEQQMAERFPGVLLAGCSYYGVGIPDCMANGEQTAAHIAELLQ